MKRKIIWGLVIAWGLLLLWGVKFSKIKNSDFKVNVNDYQWFEVIKVVDGDTIELNIDNKLESIRLIGIDAPEIEEKTKQKGLESKNYLKNLIGREKVRLEADETQDDRDVYDRLLRYVFLKDGKMINREMIRSKMAKEYTFKVPYKYQEEFKNIGK